MANYSNQSINQSSDNDNDNNDDIERELYQLGITDEPPPPQALLRGAPPLEYAWAPPLPPKRPPPLSTRSQSAPTTQEQDYPVSGGRSAPHRHNPFPGSGRETTAEGAVSVGGLYWGAPHQSLTNLYDNPTRGGHNPRPTRAPPPIPTSPSPPPPPPAGAVYNGLTHTTLPGIHLLPPRAVPPEAVTLGDLAALPILTSAAAFHDPGAVHYPGYVMAQDFTLLPRGGRQNDLVGVLGGPDPGDATAAATDPPAVDVLQEEDTEEDEERLRALVSSVEAALRRIHSGLQESYIMYENPDDEREPPPPQPLNTTLRDPPPSPMPHEPPEGTGPPLGGALTTHTRLIGPDNASRLSQEIGFIPIREGAPRPPLLQETQQPQPLPRPPEHYRPPLVQIQVHPPLLQETHQQPPLPRPPEHYRHHHHYHKLSKKYKNHKSKVLLSGLMTCPEPGFRLLHIRRDPTSTQGFGFSIKGGREAAGIGVYVSRVERGGAAWRAGLRPGDLVLAANHTNFSSVSHAQAIALLKTAQEVTLTVATTSQLQQPGSSSMTHTHSSYSWVTTTGSPTTPPPEYNPRLHHHQLSKVSLEVHGSESLGLMIRGGVEYGLGIFITGVDSNSAAEKAGLKIGDQILEVNKDSFQSVTHDSAVSVLKYSRGLELVLRRVGKVPHSCTTIPGGLYDPLAWTWPHYHHANGESMEAVLTMIDEKSHRLLSRSNHVILKEVVSDYAAGRAPVEDLLLTAKEVLITPDKMSLVSELREVVRPEDQDKFDQAMFTTSQTTTTTTTTTTITTTTIDKDTHSEAGVRVKTIPQQQQHYQYYQHSPPRARGEFEHTHRREDELFEHFEHTDEHFENLDDFNEHFEHYPPRARPFEHCSSRTRVRGEFEHCELSPPRARGRDDDYEQGSFRDLSPRFRDDFEHCPLRARGDSYECSSPRDIERCSRDNFDRSSPRTREFDHSLSRAREYEHCPSPSRARTIDHCSPSRTRRDCYECSSPSAGEHCSPSRPGEYQHSPSRTRRDSCEHCPRRARGIEHCSPSRDSPSRQRDYEHTSRKQRSSPRTAEFDHSPSTARRDSYECSSSRFIEHSPSRVREYTHSVSRTRTSDHCSPSRDIQHSSRPRDVEQSPSKARRDSYEHTEHCPPRARVHPTTASTMTTTTTRSYKMCGGGEEGGVTAPPSGSNSSNQQQARNRRTSLVMSDSEGRFRVLVKKGSRPNLGIAIEGGADTPQTLPRVINIGSKGAAFEAGGLRVGQLIVQVDGHNLQDSSEV